LQEIFAKGIGRELDVFRRIAFHSLYLWQFESIRIPSVKVPGEAIRAESQSTQSDCSVVGGFLDWS
jgi:hypothetical protein